MQEQLQRGQASSRTDAVRTEFCAIVASQGAGAALAWLNARTRFRFTGIYHVDPPLLRNVVLFDRENPTLNLSGEVVPLEETYCALTRSLQAPFSTDDSRQDPRLVNHAARESVISYAGVPLWLGSGQVWGSLCHFDVRPRLLPKAERALLESFAPFLLDCVAASKENTDRSNAPHVAEPADSRAR